MADITYTTEDDEAVFSASTPAGETFLGGPERRVPLSGAVDFVQSAKDQGLSVVPFP